MLGLVIGLARRTGGGEVEGSGGTVRWRELLGFL